MNQTVDFNDFQKLDLRIAKITKAEAVAGADKLLRIELNVGDLGSRQVVAGIKQWYSAEDLQGKKVVYLANLDPKEIMGVKSEGMIMAAGEEEPVLLIPDQEINPGARIR
jgi:methionyl-tRNA synthetase